MAHDGDELDDILNSVVEANQNNSEKDNPTFFGGLVLKGTAGMVDRLGRQVMSTSGGFSKMRLEQYSAIAQTFIKHMAPVLAQIEAGENRKADLAESLDGIVKEIEAVKSKLTSYEAVQTQSNALEDELEKKRAEATELIGAQKMQIESLEASEARIEDLKSIAGDMTAQIANFKQDIEARKQALENQSGDIITAQSVAIIEAVASLEAQTGEIITLTEQAQELLGQHFEFNEKAVQAMDRLSGPKAASLSATLKTSQAIADLLAELDNQLKKCIKEQDETQKLRASKI